MKADGATSIEKLLSLGSEPLGPNPASLPALLEPYSLGSELFRMLWQKNGFYAFESALHVFPTASSDCMSLEEWNAPSLWRDGYHDLAKGLIFFAEDILQDQFCLSNTGVIRFHSETGENNILADSIENWAALLLRDHRKETGWPLASEWQRINGPLPPGKRLMPKVPFVLGGKYSLENLWAGDSVQGMRFKGDLAMQSREVPDGGSVRLVLGKRPRKQ